MHAVASFVMPGLPAYVSQSSPESEREPQTAPLRTLVVQVCVDEGELLVVRQAAQPERQGGRSARDKTHSKRAAEQQRGWSMRQGKFINTCNYR